MYKTTSRALYNFLSDGRNTILSFATAQIRRYKQLNFCSLWSQKHWILFVCTDDSIFKRNSTKRCII